MHFRVLAGVGWIFEAKAEVRHQLPGGVLADEMGAGKTVTTIALIAAGRAFAKKKSEKKDATCSSASLIIAPPTLIAQWNEERKKFTGDTLGTILLPDASALKSITVQQLLDADMVIASFELLAENAYMKNLQAKAGYEGLPDTIPSGSGHKEPERMKGIWVPGHPAAVYGTAKGKQQLREEMAYSQQSMQRQLKSLGGQNCLQIQRTLQLSTSTGTALWWTRCIMRFAMMRRRPRGTVQHEKCLE